MLTPDPDPVPEPMPLQWSPQERESFFAAIERHRRAARRVEFVSLSCALALAIVVALLTAPVWYAVLGLVLDIVNFVVPTPDLFRAVMIGIDPLIDSPADVPAARWFYLAFLAALPGVAVMGLVLWSLSRIMREAMMLDAGQLAARPPDGSVLAEQRFANVIAEMAIAAELPQPRVLVAESASANAAAFGADDGHTTIVVTRALLERLDRAELQGVAAHLVGSIANGDMSMGTRVAALLGLFGLVAGLSHSFADREAARRFMLLLRSAVRRGPSVEDGQLALALTNPFQPLTAPATPAPADDDNKLPWRTFAWMPLAGPLVISGFFGGLLSTFVLGPLIALLWRRRKLLADATAVRLTREPNTLAGALQKIRSASSEGAFAPWVTHMTVAHAGKIGSSSILTASGVRMFPLLEARLKRLGVLGATVSTYRAHRLPAGLSLVLAPIAVLLAVLFSAVIVLLAGVSVAVSGIFTWLPAVILDALLR